MEGGRKLIVFGHHRSVLDSISDALTAKVSFDTCMITTHAHLMRQIICMNYDSMMYNVQSVVKLVNGSTYVRISQESALQLS